MQADPVPRRFESSQRDFVLLTDRFRYQFSKLDRRVRFSQGTLFWKQFDFGIQFGFGFWNLDCGI